MGMEDETGSLKTGNSADLIILDKPLNIMTAKEIAQIKIKTTVWMGETVYSKTKGYK